MRIRPVAAALVAVSSFALLSGCLVPFPWPFPTSQPTVSQSPGGDVASPSPSPTVASAPPTTTPPATIQPTAPALQPDPKAAQHIPDVGTMPSGFKLPGSGYDLNGFEAIRFCRKDPWYPALAQRTASRFRSRVSETYESGGSMGVVILTSQANAEALMAELRAAAAACQPKTAEWMGKPVTVPSAGPWQDAFGVAIEYLDKGKPIVDAYGTTALVVRRGRTVAAATTWTMYSQPVSGEPAEIDGLLSDLAAVLKTTP